MNEVRPSEEQGHDGRATFSSTWGTVLTTAGVAIGLGNIWRFPYMMGKYGGGAFLLAYLGIMVAFGVPALMAEWALGRYARRGTWGAFQHVGVRGGKWWAYLLLLTVTMAASYYGVVLARVLSVACAFAARLIGQAELGDALSASSGFGMQVGFVAVTVVAACAALYCGVERGIERVSRVVLPLCFVLFVILIVRVLTLPGAIAQLQTFIRPRWSDFTPSTALASVGQAFFSLALGGTFMVVYGSYMREKEDIPKGAALTAVADVGAALMAALVVVPAALVLEVPLSSGPPLMFDVMPRVFGKMPAGDLWGGLFFGCVFVLALLSLMAAFEVVVAACGDAWNWTRGRSLTALLVLEMALAIPAIVVGPYIEYSDFIWGSTMQPVGGVMAVVALTWCVGRVRTLEEIGRNSRLPVPQWLFYWLKFGVPVGIVGTLIYGWADSSFVRSVWSRLSS